MTHPEKVAYEAENVTAGYGSVPVITGVNLRIEPGSITAVLGANGAGKTTLLRTFAGEIAPLSGRITRSGQTVTSTLHRRVRTGLGYIPEQRCVFGKMTVDENLRIGFQSRDRALDLFPELKPLLGRRAGKLSGGEQQMLAVGRALASNPDILLADELSMGLAPLVVTRIHQALRAAADEGAGILLVEQHVRQVLKVADMACVLKRGKIVLQGSADEVGCSDDALRAAYL